MADQYPTHEHVGVASGIAAFLFSIYSFFKRSRKEMYERIDRKADAEHVDKLGDRIEAKLDSFEKRNDEAHERIYQNLITLGLKKGNDND